MFSVGFAASNQRNAMTPVGRRTRRRAAAYGHRAFNAGFPAMNPIGRPSQPDTLLSFGLQD